MIYCYYRVSTDKQDYESQRIGVMNYCVAHKLHVDCEIIDDGISGTVLAKKRKLGWILRKLKANDKIIVSELSRLGRSTADVINTCNTIIAKGAQCVFVKQNMQIDTSPVGKILITLFAAFSEMERDLIVQRTKEGLERARQNGKKLGRPYGSESKSKVAPFHDKIKEWREKGITRYRIAKNLKVKPSTITHYCQRENI